MKLHHRKQQQKPRSNADYVASLQQPAQRKTPSPATTSDNLSREQQYEIALSDCNYDPDKVQGYDEYKPGGERYNHSMLYNLRILERRRGYRPLGITIIGDYWTDPSTEAGQKLHHQATMHNMNAGSRKVNEPHVPFQPSKELLSRQMAQQLNQQVGPMGIVRITAAAVKKYERYKKAIHLKTKDESISTAEKNYYLAKESKLDAPINKLLQSIGVITKEPVPQIDQSNMLGSLAPWVLAGLGAAVATIVAEEVMLGLLVSILYFEVHEVLDDVELDDLLRDTGVGLPEDKGGKQPDPVKAPKPLPLSTAPEQEEKEDCEVKPVGRHLGNDPIHDQCADFAPPNVFMGSDVLVVTPDGRRKHFDAMDASGALWEVKTLNYSAYPQFLKKITIAKNKKEMKDDLHVASACGRKFIFAVSDSEHFNDLFKQMPRGVELRLVNCLTTKE